MSGRAAKLLRKFLQHPLRKVDKMVWDGLTSKQRGEIRAVVKSGRHIARVGESKPNG